MILWSPIVLVVVLIVGPKLFVEPGGESAFLAFERERPRIVITSLVLGLSSRVIVVLMLE
jgi:hypothetical protein